MADSCILGGMIAQQYRDEMVRLMETVLEEIAPREPCGAAEGRLGEILRRRWGELGHAVLSLALYPIVGLNLSDVMPSRPRRLR